MCVCVCVCGREPNDVTLHNGAQESQEMISADRTCVTADGMKMCIRFSFFCDVTSHLHHGGSLKSRMYFNLLRPSASLRTTTFYIKKVLCSASFYVRLFLRLFALTPITNLHQFLVFWGEGGLDSPQWARAPSFTRFLDHTQRRTTVGRTPLDE